jgi:hypothetical protein
VARPKKKKTRTVRKKITKGKNKGKTRTVKVYASGKMYPAKHSETTKKTPKARRIRRQRRKRKRK